MGRKQGNGPFVEGEGDVVENGQKSCCFARAAAAAEAGGRGSREREGERESGEEKRERKGLKTSRAQNRKLAPTKLQ